MVTTSVFQHIVPKQPLLSSIILIKYIYKYGCSCFVWCCSLKSPLLHTCIHTEHLDKNIDIFTSYEVRELPLYHTASFIPRWVLCSLNKKHYIGNVLGELLIILLFFFPLLCPCVQTDCKIFSCCFSNSVCWIRR